MTNPIETLPLILLRGGGDLASGVALRLRRVGFSIVITELAHPLMVRRTVSFAQAVYDGRCQVEECTGELAADVRTARTILQHGSVAVLVDPDATCADALKPDVIVDARMTKLHSDQSLGCGCCVIGLGPGFIAGVNCLALVETQRGPNLGRVFWQGSAEPDNRVPERVNGIDTDRVIHAPVEGTFMARVRIGEHVEAGQVIAMVGSTPIPSRIQGVVRGLLQDGLTVTPGLKVGDIDPRDDPRLCSLVSDKALAVGGGVLEALFVCLHSKMTRK